MIQNFDFVKKNEIEIYREKCCVANQSIEKILEKLQYLRKVIYQCNFSKEKPLLDSKFQEDIKFIQKLIKKCSNLEQQKVFLKTIDTLIDYKSEFQLVSQVINSNLKQNVAGRMRSYSTNHKMLENIQTKQDLIQNYFYSLDDSDSPCKVRLDVFTF
ncbi:hypothetical protein TTHERM_01016140 (macronuclear) [Tetrahymena thermophila SB210]|uniref:Uncharacterized protein n=1 Tax=Tetrahymena thermophila (strain SB210) TaxID=312017 RepID=Q22CS7_TETTS|nr:hypothetical protein TTHERM_01016140 [Tetrahymena thermophila SB210]EAR83111.1 hypothetical protein TTHERM_01016140 [Tetrahymena thermophila SB210]|eukprot:XP_001030774.1 hypothetical protein TTHERM_01016140 [Tetrahymena thermophila SB210]